MTYRFTTFVANGRTGGVDLVFHRVGTTRGTPEYEKHAVVVSLTSQRNIKSLSETLQGYTMARSAMKFTKEE